MKIAAIGTIPVARIPDLLRVQLPTNGRASDTTDSAPTGVLALMHEQDGIDRRLIHPLRRSGAAGI